MRRSVRLPAALLITAAALGTSGCSQVAQLRGVAGAQQSAVRTATNDVLVAKSIDIRVAPVCTFDAAVTYTCTGTTPDGASITSTAVVRSEYGTTKDAYGGFVPADVSLAVTVGGTTIYDGTVQDILQSAGQVSR